MNLRCIDVAHVAGLQPGKKAGDEVLFTCPRHDDQHPSLSINTGKNAWLCGPCGTGGNAWELAAFLLGTSPEDKTKIACWLRDKGLLAEKGNGGKRIVATYPYRAEDGRLLFEVVRYEPKGFAQRRPDGKGGWIWNLEGVRLVPYRLPEWRDSKWVCMVEGEKDSDNLWRLGIPATCNPMGAGKWRNDFDAYFAGKRVAILRDNDRRGEDHALDVARHLLPTANAVKIVRLSGLPAKGDVSDWIDRGGTRDELLRIIKETSTLTSADLDASTQSRKETDTPERFRYVSAFSVPAVHEIPDVEIEFVVNGLLPKNSVTVVAAVPGGMKSYLALDLSHRIASGESFAGRKTIQMPVLYLDRENPDRVVRERLDYLGIRFSPGLHYWGGWLPEWPPLLDDPRVVAFAKETHGLIVVDSLIRFNPARDENDSAEMARVMETLRCLQRFGATVLVLHHASEKSAYLYRGSSEILGGCDELYSIRKLDDFTIELDWKEKTRFGVDKHVALKRERGGFVATEIEHRTLEKPSECDILKAMLTLVTENPGLNKTALVDLAAPNKINQKEARVALAKMENDPRIRVEDGPRGARLYFPALDPVVEVAF